jgi:hypothetical protein
LRFEPGNGPFHLNTSRCVLTAGERENDVPVGTGTGEGAELVQSPSVLEGFRLQPGNVRSNCVVLEVERTTNNGGCRDDTPATILVNVDHLPRLAAKCGGISCSVIM